MLIQPQARRTTTGPTRLTALGLLARFGVALVAVLLAYNPARQVG
jgi:hypothetical protein